MINLLSLALLLSSLAAAGLWSPSPEPKQSNSYKKDGELVREGHRLIVVEYERQAPRGDGRVTPQKLMEEAAALLPDVRRDGSQEPVQEQNRHSAKEMICDAYGRCKEKLSSIVGTGREKLHDKAVDVEEGAEDLARRAGEEANNLKDSASRVVKGGVEKAHEMEEDVKDSAKDVLNRARGAAGKVSKMKEEAVENVSTVKEGTKEAVEKASKLKDDAVDAAKEKASDAVEKASKLKDDAVYVVKEKASEVKHRTKEAIKDVEDTIERKTEEVRGNLTDIMQRMRGVVVDAAAYVWSAETGRAAAVVLQLLGLATAYGTCVWVTFISSHVLATVLPRQQFGVVQSKLYPVYFRALAYGVGAALVGHYFGRSQRLLGEKMQNYNLFGALAMVMVNMLFLEPKATKVMFERIKMEKEEGRGQDMADVIVEPVAGKVATNPVTAGNVPVVGVARATVSVDQDAVKGRMVKLNKKLRKLNNYSSLTNVVTLMSLTWHLMHIAKQSQISC